MHARTLSLTGLIFPLAAAAALMLATAPAPLFADAPVAPAGTAPAAAPAAAADAAPMPEDQAAAQALALAVQRLSLTPEQTAKVKPLLDQQVRKLRQLFADYTGGGANVMPSFLQEFKKTRDDFAGNVRPILTEAQRPKFDHLRQEVDDALRDQVCDWRIGTLKDRLALTPEQQTAVRPIFKEDFEQKRALLSAYTGPTGGPAARKWLSDEARKVQATTEVKLAEVLNPDQMKSYRAFVAEKIETSENAAAQP